MYDDIGRLIDEMERGEIVQIDGYCAYCGTEALIKNFHGTVLCDICGRIRSKKQQDHE